MHIDKLKRYSPCTCEKGVVASQVSAELLPVWVVAGIATLFLMMKSTTASRENYKHTSRGHPQEEKLFLFGPNNTFWTIYSTSVLLELSKHFSRFLKFSGHHFE